MPSQKMAVVRSKSTPDEVFSELIQALYDSVYNLNVDLKKKGLTAFKFSGLCITYPNDHLALMEE